MIILPKKEIILPFKQTIGMQGFLRLQTINKFSGKITSDTGFFPNQLLTAGMNIMADHSNWMNYCQVGTDNTAPSAVQTSMLGHVAGTSTIQSTISGQASSSPYYGWKRKVFRFSAGTVAANLNEVGVGWGTTGSTLISRALILDPVSQLPTTVTPLADEILDVTYELRYYAPTSDKTGPQVTLDGTVYNTTTRAAYVTSVAWSQDIGAAIAAKGGTSYYWTAYDDVLGAVTTGPSGLTANPDTSSPTTSGYSNNSFEVAINISCGPSGWNLGSGIRSIRIYSTVGAFQTQFSAASGGATIPKNSNYTMTMSWMLSWGARPADWDSGETYSAGDTVIHNDLHWSSDINGNTSEPGIANWTQYWT